MTPPTGYPDYRANPGRALFGPAGTTAGNTRPIASVSSHVLAVVACFVALSVVNPAITPDGAAKQRRAYYGLRYPGENGPFSSKRAAVDAALVALQARAAAEEWSCEWLAIISRDRYGRWWHTTPKMGSEVAPNQCEVTYSSAEIRRPGSKLVATAHTHPRGDLFPDPRPNSPDNRNDHEMFLIRSDGHAWRFGPRSTIPIPYQQAGASLCSRAD